MKAFDICILISDITALLNCFIVCGCFSVHASEIVRIKLKFHSSEIVRIINYLKVFIFYYFIFSVYTFNFSVMTNNIDGNIYLIIMVIITTSYP
jgi:hypothetical protein